MSTPFRSGSALSSKIINAHSQIGLICDKLKYFTFCYNRYKPFTTESINKLLNDVDKRLRGRFDIVINIEECFEEIQSYEYSDKSIYSTLLNHIYKDYDYKYIGETECLSWTKIPYVLEMFPKSKALMNIRDLRDVVVSFKKSTYAPDNDYLIALFNVINAMDHCIEYENAYPDRFFGIRYESLKANPEKEVHKICKFLGVDFEPSMLDQNNWLEFDGSKWGNTAVSSFHNEVDGISPVGRWRQRILPEDLYLCEWIGRKQLIKFGFNIEGKCVDQHTFNLAIEKITSSTLLQECFKNWCDTGNGVEKYPLDPTDPKTWDLSDVKNPDIFNLAKKN